MTWWEWTLAALWGPPTVLMCKRLIGGLGEASWEVIPTVHDASTARGWVIVLVGVFGGLLLWRLW